MTEKDDFTSNSDGLKRLHTLQLDNCISKKLFSNTADGLKHLRNLEVLRISIGQAELLKLINNLDKHRSLRILNLEQVNLRPAGATAISSSLKHCTTLTTLNLRENTIEKKGAEELSTAFQYWPSLQELNLNGTASQANVGRSGAMVLADNLRFCTQLSKLHLEYNDINEEVARVLLENQNLAELHLHGNPVRKEWARTIVFPYEIDEKVKVNIISQQTRATTEPRARRCCIIL